jgi:ABC-type multidrug transport system fused ATPase/permease subunit
MSKVFFLFGFFLTFILDHVREDSLKDMKRRWLLQACDPFVYFYWVMQTQLVRNNYGISLYQVQAKGIMTIFHVVVGLIIFMVAQQAEYRVNN